MSDIVGSRPPAWFWILAGLGLLWELYGVSIYLMHVGMLPSPAEMSETDRMLMESSPTWVTAMFAIAVFAGVAGAIALLLRRRWARPLLLVSLGAVVLQFGGWLLMTEAMSVKGPSVFVMPAIIVLVAIGLVWLATAAAKRGWLA